MSDLIKKVKEKLDEYGFDIFKDYSVEEDGRAEHVILAEDMILFVRPGEKEMSVAFQATIKPDAAARNLLILSEVINPKKIDITEAFIYNDKREMLSGDEAYELVQQSIKQQGINEFIQEQTLNQLLETTECYEC